MKKEELYTRIAAETWDREMADRNNYNDDFESFRSDFVGLCDNIFCGIVLVQGDAIE